MTRILAVGQTPPPYHGQAIMIDNMLRGDYGALQLVHVRMAFSDAVGEVGRFRLRKLVELVRVAGAIAVGRVVYRAPILYYPPAGPHLVPVLRDIFLLLATRWMFRKTIFHFHAGGLSDLYETLSPPLRFLFRLAYAHPDLAIRTSAHAPEDGKKLKAKRECVIPYGIEDEYRPEHEAAAEPAPPQILFVGLLSESKGVVTLLEALKVLRDKGLSFHANLVGAFESAAFERRARGLVEEGGLDRVVTFPGVLTGDKKREVFAAADIFCFPTYYEAESFGVVLIEAMSFALPVVATRWRGVPDIVLDGKCGFLVPVKDSQALADSLERLIRDPVLRRIMGEQGRQRYLECYTIEGYHRRLREAFEQIAASVGPQAEPPGRSQQAGFW